METTLNSQKSQENQSKLTFSQWMLRTIKKHKKRTNTDAVVGLVVSAALFLIALV
ncbi:hypothetical protein [Evansella halocellulosilytica]|uniref:hypothetical protein n=1 Tax=Evansella halocellulosilytica TaxID=2011013 RepID=UPI0015C8AB89|nr:hypothetical protein [Evansella halocellulosilytica]